MNDKNLTLDADSNYSMPCPFLDAIVRRILKYVEGSHDIVEQVRASSVITCFAGCSREVTQQIADIANLDILGKDGCRRNISLSRMFCEHHAFVVNGLVIP